ncbi:MAG: hypothetical protein ABSG99_09425 [Sedimentisphaerales bacterium]
MNKYQQLDVPTGADFVVIARGVYHGISAVSEPVVLLLLGSVAVMLYAAGRITPLRKWQNQRQTGAHKGNQ